MACGVRMWDTGHVADSRLSTGALCKSSSFFISGGALDGSVNRRGGGAVLRGDSWRLEVSTRRLFACSRRMGAANIR